MKKKIVQNPCFFGLRKNNCEKLNIRLPPTTEVREALRASTSALEEPTIGPTPGDAEDAEDEPGAARIKIIRSTSSRSWDHTTNLESRSLNWTL